MELNQSETYPKEFRVFLQDELVRRIRTNPKYSMRTFAKFLGVESSRLSKMLRGQRPIRGLYVESFGNKIGLRPDIVDEYKRAAESKSRGSQVSASDANYMQIALDTFEIISDTIHYAILSLTLIKDFQPSNKWVAQKLGVSINEVSSAVERLIRAGLLVIEADGKWRDTSNGCSTSILGKNTTTNAHKKMQEQVLRKAIEALHNVPIQERDQSSMTVTTSVNKMNQAKEMIKDFRRQLGAFLESGTDHDSVYQISVSLFPMTVNTPVFENEMPSSFTDTALENKPIEENNLKEEIVDKKILGDENV